MVNAGFKVGKSAILEEPCDGYLVTVNGILISTTLQLMLKLKFESWR